MNKKILNLTFVVLGLSYISPAFSATHDTCMEFLDGCEAGMRIEDDAHKASYSDFYEIGYCTGYFKPNPLGD
jgi:hypothetical protein